MIRQTRRSATGRDRAVSTTLGYALTLGIAMLLISGLLIAMGGLVTQQRERAVRTELQVIGQRIAADLTAADRLAQATAVGGSGRAVVVGREHPHAVLGATYLVNVETGSGGAVLVLSTRTPDVSVRVGFATSTPVAETSVSGGHIRVRFADTDGDGQKERLVVENA